MGFILFLIRVANAGVVAFLCAFSVAKMDNVKGAVALATFYIVYGLGFIYMKMKKDN